MYTLDTWLNLTTTEIAEIVSVRAATAAVYLNGTRRWFLSRSQNWEDYPAMTAAAHRELNQLLYVHGVQTLIQPLLGYDLLERGRDYLNMAVEPGLMELVKPNYLDWLHQLEVRVSFYGNWQETLQRLEYDAVVDSLMSLTEETQNYTRHKLLFGVFADEGLDRIVSLAQQITDGDALMTAYYGQPVAPVNLVIGSGQPAIWDLPLLDINKASLYFMQAPTFYLDQRMLRSILYDYLYHRVNDEAIYEGLSEQYWQRYQVIGLGKQSQGGWIAI